MQHPYSWICLPFHPLSSSWAPVEVLTGSCVRYTSCGLAFYACPPTNQRSNLSAAAGPFPDRGGTDDGPTESATAQGLGVWTGSVTVAGASYTCIILIVVIIAAPIALSSGHPSAIKLHR